MSNIFMIAKGYIGFDDLQRLFVDFLLSFFVGVCLLCNAYI